MITGSVGANYISPNIIPTKHAESNKIHAKCLGEKVNF